MVEVKNLTKKYGDKLATNNISFVVNKGEVIGFLGPNGAGKSTTMNIITGYLSSTKGSVTIDGVNILDNPTLAKKKIGYLPEHPPLYLDMTVAEYLDFVYDLKKVKNNKKAHIKEICELVKISDVYKRVIKNLSKGYKQRVGLAQALLGNPDVLILDEPTVGLDPKQIIEIRSLIENLGKEHTIILSSHILTEIQAVCDRVIVISHGSLVADDTPDNLAKHLSDDHSLIIRVDGAKKDVLKALQTIIEIKNIIVNGEKEPNVFEYTIESNDNVDVRRKVSNTLAQNHFAIMSMKNNMLTLEDIFLKLTTDDAAFKQKAIDLLNKKNNSENIDVVKEDTSLEESEVVEELSENENKEEKE